MKIDKAELFMKEESFFTDEEAEPTRADALVRTESFDFTKDQLLRVIDHTIEYIEK